MPIVVPKLGTCQEVDVGVNACVLNLVGSMTPRAHEVTVGPWGPRGMHEGVCMGYTYTQLCIHM